MKPLFEVTPLDHRIYETQLRDFLPQRIIDVHTHAWLKKHQPPTDPATAASTVKSPGKVAAENPIEDLLETYRLLFPGKTVTPVIFDTVPTTKAGNEYCARSAKKHGCYALLFSRPEWSGAELLRRIRRGGFCGVKSYLTEAPSYLPTAEIRIYDFFPPHQLEVLNELGLIMMLHIPRDQRLRDPVNLAQMMEIDRRWPRIGTIIAHVGRAYCPEDIGNAFDVLGQSKHLLFDISANTSQCVFEALLRGVGPQRVLFGSDLPILRMRMRRICERGRYINLVPRGLYGDVRDDSHLREVDGLEATRLTFFMYEELLAFRRAAETCRLGSDDIKDVFYRNAARILRRIEKRRK